MGYKTGTDRNQLTFLPPCLDDYVPEDHICRVIRAFTAQLDMKELGYKYAKPKDLGAPSFDPRMMLNLYLYGYLNRTRSSRRLEAETKRNVEVMWLMCGLAPDDKTICNFRKDNAKQLRDTFRVFSLMLRQLGLYGGEIEVTDGTKFRANSSRKNHFNEAKVKRELSWIDKKISEYMSALEQGDKEEEGETVPSAEDIKVALEKLNERKVDYEKLMEQVNTNGETSTVDPDARFMRSGGDARAVDVCYNVQTTVDSKHHLIVCYDVVQNANDLGNLHSMSEKAKEALGVDSFTQLADKGYYDGKDIDACEKDGITCMIAKQNPHGGKAKEERFTLDDFRYDREKDCYTCPCENQLAYKRIQKQKGVGYRLYENYAACKQCTRRSECTKSWYRVILRSPHQDILDTVTERTKNNKELYQKRKEVVEHVFGIIKAIWGYKQFLCKSKKKVEAETSLAYMAYNVRRAINIFKAEGKDLVAALGR
jgi:transposase